MDSIIRNEGLVLDFIRGYFWEPLKNKQDHTINMWSCWKQIVIFFYNFSHTSRTAATHSFVEGIGSL